MKDIGLKIYKMIMVLKLGKMVQYIKVNILLGKKRIYEHIYGVMAINIKGNS